MKYSFYDDYSEGVHPEILRYIGEHNDDQQLGYGRDNYSQLAADRIRKAFGLPHADVHFSPSGTATNVICLRAMLQPYEGVITPHSGHIYVHETGAPEAAGIKLIPVPSQDGKLTTDMIDSAFGTYEDEHTIIPRVVYLTQATELGTVYSPSELQTIINHAKAKGLLVFIDGARLAMALTSKNKGMSTTNFGSLGADIFYVGGTKAGGMYGEAIVIVNPELQHHFRNQMKQRGALMAKGRFMGQQFARFFDQDGLWMALGAQANENAAYMHRRLAEAGMDFDLTVDANQVFPIIENTLVEELEKDYGFYRWTKVSDTQTKIRLVCSWATPVAAIDKFIDRVTELRHAKGQ
jgi:threonine aldolase